jgi:hypothetical protein
MSVFTVFDIPMSLPARSRNHPRRVDFRPRQAVNCMTPCVPLPGQVRADNRRLAGPPCRRLAPPRDGGSPGRRAWAAGDELLAAWGRCLRRRGARPRVPPVRDGGTGRSTPRSLVRRPPRLDPRECGVRRTASPAGGPEPAPGKGDARAARACAPSTGRSRWHDSGWSRSSATCGCPSCTLILIR